MDINIGADIVLPVNIESLPAVAVSHAMYIGLRNILMDSHASVIRKDFNDDESWVAAKKAVAEKKLAALIAGDVKQTVTRGRVADPVKREAVKMATETVVAKAKKTNEKLDAKTIHARALKLVADNGAYMHLAAKHVEERKALGIEEIDTDELEPAGDESPATE